MSITDRAKDRAKKNPTFLMIILVVAHLAVISMNRSPSNSDLSVLRVGLTTITTPIQMAFAHSTSWVKNTFSNYFSLRDARSENASLKSERVRLEQKILEQNEKLNAFEQLEAFKEWNKANNYETVPARVIARDANRVFNTILIDKGSINDVQKDQPVVTPEGLVGRVISVQPFSSQVLLITDERSGVGVESQAIAQSAEKRSLGFIRGKGRNEYFCDFKVISTTEKVHNGEKIITSGLDGVYPKGLLIGTIRNADRDPLEVQPAAPLASLETVAVLKISPEEIKKASRELADLDRAERLDDKKPKAPKKP